MSYEKQNFTDGQVLTAEQLNHMEEGIAAAGGKPMPVILDTDWWTDIDDAVAIKVLLWAEREGLCDILGLIVDAVNADSARSLSRYLDYLGRGDLPFALEKNATDYGGTPSYFSAMISSWTHGFYSSNAYCHDEGEGEYYISMLKSLPDGEKCNIICIGYLSALAGLFKRAEADPTIYNLIVNKVNKIFVMAGNYPSGSENNFTRNSRSRQAGHDVCEKCPSEIPMIFLGYEVGETVLSGGTTGEAIGEFDLLYKGMVAHGEGAAGRSSWDPMTMLLALMDNENMSGYKLVRGTNVVNPSTGANVFTANSTGHHYYVVKKYPDAWYEHQINSIVEQRAWGFRKLGEVQYNPEPITEPVGYATVTFNGSENWQFNTSDEPNSHGFYNAYVINPNLPSAPALGYFGFAEATCNYSALDRNIEPNTEDRQSTSAGGFGYHKNDPSIFIRFNSSIATSVETLKAWLAENNLTITYKIQ